MEVVQVTTAPAIRFPVASPPAEAEIRELLEDDGFGRIIGCTSWRDAWGAFAAKVDELYDTEDLRNSERDDLDALVEFAVDPIFERVHAELTDALVSAVLTFVAKHPDAPRAAR